MAGSDVVSSTVKEIFRREAREILDHLDEGIRELQERGTDPKSVNNLFRLAHNLKGAAKTAGFARIGEMAHVVEELLTRWRDQRLRPTSAQIEWVAGSLECLEELLEPDEDADENGRRQRDQQTTQKSNHQTMRVPIRDLDTSVNLVGELVITNGRIEAHARSHQESGLLDLSETLSSLLAQLQEQLMHMRLVPIAELLDRSVRSANETARRLKKSVNIQTLGADTLVDAAFLEALRDPLNHMIRNSVDHGIETPDEREAVGKPRVGTVILEARREAGNAIIELLDDGRGLNPRAIREKAERLGLTTSEANLRDDEIFDFIFQPGFSTAAKIDDISGRGVGMDVVRHNVEKLHGSIAIESAFGQGTRFIINIPMNLSIARGFHILQCDQQFVLPAENVLECIPMQHAKTKRRNADGTSTIELRGHPIACLDLASVVGSLLSRQSSGKKDERPKTIPEDTSNSPHERRSVLIVEHAEQHFAIIVDRILGEQRTVLKPLGRLLADVREISGATVLGDGSVGLLLDFARLIERVRNSELQHLQSQSAA